MKLRPKSKQTQHRSACAFFEAMGGWWVRVNAQQFISVTPSFSNFSSSSARVLQYLWGCAWSTMERVLLFWPSCSLSFPLSFLILSLPLCLTLCFYPSLNTFPQGTAVSAAGPRHALWWGPWSWLWLAQGSPSLTEAASQSPADKFWTPTYNTPWGTEELIKMHLGSN